MRRVACIGNMNNNFFSLARYLRDKGIQAELLLRNNEFEHFSPDADCYDQSYFSYTRSLSWGHALSWYTTPAKKILSDLKEYDFLIGCGTVPAYLSKSRRTLDMFIPYGADLYGFPFMKFPWFIPLLFHFSKAQKTGIQTARNVCLDYANDLFEKPLQLIAPAGDRLYLAIPMLYTPEYSTQRIIKFADEYPHTKLFKKIRNDHFPIVFHQTRHNWKTSPDQYTWKGNDELIRGFADFTNRREKDDQKPALVLLEYGSDVAASKTLTRQLGIENHVYWFPQMTRKELMIGLHFSDIGSGEFANSWLFCGTVIEALTMAKPLLHYRQDELYQKRYPELYPHMNVRTAEEITNALVDYTRRPDHYRASGLAGQAWLKKYVIEGPVNQIVDMINSP